MPRLNLAANVVCTLLCLLYICSPARAQQNTWQNLSELKSEIARGRRLLENGDASSHQVLRATAQNALQTALQIIGPDILTTSQNLPQTGAAGDLLRQASQAHLLWGLAAERFHGAAGRDEAITAWTRALRLANSEEFGANIPAAEAKFRLASALRQGLPLIAPDDTLQTIAEQVHANSWKPRRFSLDLSTLGSDFSKNLANDATRDFLITSGQLAPPISAPNAAETQPTIVPPFYRVVAPAALPASLWLDRTVIGYARERSGANKGFWRQVVRVYYASPSRTQNQRGDFERAEALCAQFLKIHALMQERLGIENLHTPDRVTTLWLLEVSAMWPAEDENPRVQAEIGLRAPLTSPAQTHDKPAVVEPAEYSWLAAGQTAAAPGEIMFYRMAQPRSEAEWQRQLAHEYGHVTLPSFDGFLPPFEPDGNGILGESLAMLWALQLPLEQFAPLASTTLTERENIAAQLAGYVAHDLVPALRLWNQQGPHSALRTSGGEAGLEYLRGLAVYLERVYGAPVLGAALRELQAGKIELGVLRTPSLLESFGRVLEAKQFDNFPLWLPGALSTLSLQNQSFSDAAREMSERKPVVLKAGEEAAAWLYIPSSARTLRVEWQGLARDANELLRVSGDWKSTFSPPVANTAGVLSINVAGRAGWQQFTFTTSSNLEIIGAHLTRATP